LLLNLFLELYFHYSIWNTLIPASS